jgi:ribose transport system ATP-binding protein
MNIIDGILRPTAARSVSTAQPVTITAPAMAQKLGIGFVHQEIALCPTSRWPRTSSWRAPIPAARC